MTRPPPGRTQKPRRLWSFSLVEVLVSIAVLSILIIVLLSMLSSLTGAWQLGQGHNERRNIGEAVFDRMTRDLSQAAVPTDRTNTNNLEFVINPSTVTGTYENPQALFFQAPVATDGGTNGNLAVVGYFVQWVNGGGSSPGTPCLSRVLINPSASDYAVYTTPNNWINGPLLTKYAASTSSSGYAGLMAENVLGLWVQALDPQANPINQGISTTLNGEAFDSRYPYTYTNYAFSSKPMVTNIACALPSSMQVAIVVMDSRTAQRLGTYGKPTYPTLTGAFWTDVQSFYNGLPLPIRKGSEIETMTIPLENGTR